ncbi:MAG: hypothetical protein ACI88H_001638 [Cocleimonas sp.]|jgi:hypothetical protein
MIDIHLIQRTFFVDQLFIPTSNNDYLVEIPANEKMNAPTK